MRTLYVNKGLIGVLSMLPELPENIMPNELTQRFGKEISSVFDIKFIPGAALIGMNTEQAGNLVERLYGYGRQSVAMVADGRKILELVYKSYRR